MTQKLSIKSRIVGSIMGSAVGDALGAPCEGVHYKRILMEYGDFKGFADLQAVNAGWPWLPLGSITDDTVLSDLLMDAILENDGILDAHRFARQWNKFEEEIPNPDGEPINRLCLVHHIERITHLRNQFREINKRELGHGEANASNAIMYIAPVGLLCAGDPNKAALMAADVTAVNQHGRPRDVAAGYAAALSTCFVPGATVENVVEAGISFTGDYKQVREMNLMLDLARKCKTCTEFIERYHTEIIGPVLPLQDLMHLDQMHWWFTDEPMSNSWNSAEILGPTLAFFLITQGQDPQEMILASAKIGRDADTICRCASGLAGAWGGLDAIPAEWCDFMAEKNRWARIEEKGVALAELVQKLTQSLGNQLLSLGE